MAEVKVAQLKAVAEEMNRLMGLEPPIKVHFAKTEALTAEIVANAIGDNGKKIVEADGIQAEDAFSVDSYRTLEAILEKGTAGHDRVLAICEEKIAAAPPETEKPAGKGKAEKKEKPAKVEKEKPAKVEKAPRFTRATAFKQIITGSKKTKEQLDAEMVALYGGSEKEAVFQNYNFIRVLMEMGFLKLNEDKTYELV